MMAPLVRAQATGKKKKVGQNERRNVVSVEEDASSSRRASQGGMDERSVCSGAILCVSEILSRVFLSGVPSGPLVRGLWGDEREGTEVSDDGKRETRRSFRLRRSRGKHVLTSAADQIRRRVE